MLSLLHDTQVMSFPELTGLFLLVLVLFSPSSVIVSTLLKIIGQKYKNNCVDILLLFFLNKSVLNIGHIHTFFLR